MELIQCLYNKNKCLEKFLEISENFLRSAQEGNLDHINHFHDERDTILKMIEHLDKIISREASQHSALISGELKGKIQNHLDRRVQLVKSIVIVDDKIMKCIEIEKNKIAQEISKTKQNKEKVGKFKSEWIGSSGEKVDRKL